MTDDIRARAVDAALSAYRASKSDDVREVMRAAIAAYERAMWRPEGEADADTDMIVWNDGEVAVGARHNGDWFQWQGRWLRRVTHFRPLPDPPEDQP